MMIKMYNKIKRTIAILLIILLSMQSFAAVVSDNDGAAFITKAEFDSLKNNFQSQLDQYNTSIDNKIDGAISAYLAGVKIEVSTTLNTVLNEWEDVTMRNKELYNSYSLPGANINMTYYASGPRTATWNRYPSAYGLAVLGTSDKSDTKIKSVGLKDGDESDYNDLSKNKFYWTGYITDYKEEISLSKLGYNNYQDVGDAFHDIELRLYDTVKLDTIENKYYDSIDNFWDEMWLPLLEGHWKKDTTDYNYNWTPTWSGGFSQWGSEYKTDKIENKYELTWAAVNENVINPDFKNCFYTFSDNTNTSKDMLDGMNIEKAGTWLKANSNGIIPSWSDGTKKQTGWGTGTGMEGESWRRIYLESHYNPTQLSAQVYDWTRGETSGGKYKIPTLGGLGPISSDAIYLQKKDLSYTFKNTDYKKEITTMNDGFPLIYAKKDAILTWENIFKEVKGSTAVEENGEVKIILSYGEFKDESESKNKKYVQEDGTMGATEYAFTTKNKASKIKWTMQEDGWIYAKWFPAELTSSEAKSADSWSVTLEGQRSNKILFTDKS